VSPHARVSIWPGRSVCLAFDVAAGRITSNHAYYDQMTFAAWLVPGLASMN
jgi:hypothetical protein